MSDTATNLADRTRWRSMLWDATPPSVMLAEAGRLSERHRWRQAVRILAVASATVEGDDRLPVLREMAVTAADGGRHRLSVDAVYELQALDHTDADTWVAFANVALARGNHLHADSAARSAIELDADHLAAWAALAASYAGLGWFAEAERCLDRVDRSQLTGLQRWRIGRAVNRWALAKTRWPTIAVLTAVVFGILALAVGASIPLVAREWRLARIRSSGRSPEIQAMAAEAWRFEWPLRTAHAGAVVLSVGGFAAGTFLL